mgnify:CR=1 FL=1
MTAEGTIIHRLEDKNIRILQKQLTETSILIPAWPDDDLKPPLGRVLPPRRMSKQSPRAVAAAKAAALAQQDSFLEGSQIRKQTRRPRRAFAKRSKGKAKKGKGGMADPSNHVAMGEGKVLSAGGKKQGFVKDTGEWMMKGELYMKFHVDGRVATAEEVVARVRPDGTVWDLNRRIKIGKVHRDGAVEDLKGCIGVVTADGTAFDSKGNRVGSCAAGVVQSAFIFFFSTRLLLLTPV